MTDPLETLDERIASATLAEAAALVVALAARQSALAGRLLEVPKVEQQPDRLLSIEECAQRLGVSERYVYRHASQWSFTRREGRRVLFSELGLQRHMERTQ